MSHSSTQPVGLAVTTPYFRRNKWMFGIGTLGRDMVYTLVSMFLIFFLTDIIRLDDARLWWVSTIVLGVRLLDAFTDIIMGTIVDNTRTRWGAYKPWIAVGVLLSAVCTVLLFADLGDGWAYVVIFCLIYFGWSLAWTMNDIPYWALLPALSLDQAEREQAGAIAKTTASVGMFMVVIGILPITSALGDATGSPQRGWLLFAAAIVAIMVAFQLLTLLGVREPRLVASSQRTTIRGLFEAIGRNDQLLWVSLAMVLFQIGFITTTSFGTYYFKYAYGDEGMYSVFAAVLAVGQLAGFIAFPALSRRFSRLALYGVATILVIFGYLLFFFAPYNIVVLAIAGLPMFFGDAIVVVLMLMFLSDTIEYGQWKLGRRNTAVTFSLQPFINKVGAAVATQIVAVTVILTGINAADTPADVTPGGILGMKATMILLPLAFIVVGYAILRFKYKLDAATYASIVDDLRERGDLA